MHDVYTLESLSAQRRKNLRNAAIASSRAQRRAARHDVRSTADAREPVAEQLLTPSFPVEREWQALGLVAVAAAGLWLAYLAGWLV